MAGYKHHLCSYCGLLKLSKHSPQTQGCKKGSGFHSWRDLGEEGSQLYSCGHCGTNVNTEAVPSKFGCPSEKVHDWKSAIKK